MWIEVLIVLLIIAVAGHIIYRMLKSKSSGGCGCGNRNCFSKQKK